MHAGGLRFDPAWLHHSKEARVIMQVENTALSLCLLVEDCSLKNWKADKVQSRQTSVLEKLGVKTSKLVITATLNGKPFGVVWLSD